MQLSDYFGKKSAMIDSSTKSDNKAFPSSASRFLIFVLILSVFQMPEKGVAQTTNLITPNGSQAFGTSVTNLSNGNFVVSDPYWSDGKSDSVGAVYLYDGSTFTLISKLKGSKLNDRVGETGVIPLKTGNFLVLSSEWNVSTTSGQLAGAVTFVNGKTGLNDTVCAANSLVGNSYWDRVGTLYSTYTHPGSGVLLLSNGNYVITTKNFQSPYTSKVGAITWGSGATGVSGTIDSSNSLIGFFRYRYKELNLVELTNGNYVVGATTLSAVSFYEESITWGNGTGGTHGIIGSSNSILGTQVKERYAPSITPLANGNYVIGNSSWLDSLGYKGAATWGDGTKPITGQISWRNSFTQTAAYVVPLTNGNYLVGVGYWKNSAGVLLAGLAFADGNVGLVAVADSSNLFIEEPAGNGNNWGAKALANGNFFVYNTDWTNGNLPFAGAVTFGDGNIGLIGSVSASNSLVGSTANDHVGSNGIFTLANGNYIISSPYWSNGNIINAGAVTLGNGNSGTVGNIDAANSLVGSSTNDYVGRGLVSPLNNGNYVIASPNWDNGSKVDAGAVTFGSGISGVFGSINPSNSLVGNTSNDYVGNEGVFPLSNGNYVIASQHWDDGTKVDVGAVTFANGKTGITGNINSSNSLIGNIDSEMIGKYGVSILTNGNYVVPSPGWRNAQGTVGAVTWGNGKIGATGYVDSSNSLIGSNDGDSLANLIAPLTNGNYVISSSKWKNSNGELGAITWGNGSKGIHGIIDSNNSLLGLRVSSQVFNALKQGDYLAYDARFNSGKGCLTFGQGNGGTIGHPNYCNSIFGNTNQSGANLTSTDYNDVYEFVTVAFPAENRVTIFQPNGQGLAIDNDSATHGVSDNAFAPIPFVNLASCRLINSILPIDSLPLNGNITSVAFVDKTTSQIMGIPSVRRHFDINPETVSNLSTSRITLYFNQSDFTDFNNNKSIYPSLPNSSSDVNGKANLRIIQEYGTSSTGILGTYTSTNPLRFNVIDPVDSDIVWNARFNRWEVTFNTIGFGGFFAFSDGSTTGMETFKSGNSSVIVSPIPASSVLNLKVMDAKLLGQTAFVTDIQGRQVLRFTCESQIKLDIREWAAGVYCLHLPDGGVAKVVKR
ncbi:MAG: hypothetical protein ABI169_02005 [Chitinophagaceae bacterium]